VTFAVFRDHPRIRGEHSPLAPRTPASCRIIPAYAGSTSAPSTCTGCLPDHPRIRGEHLGLLFAVADREGSSPHTRGAHGDYIKNAPEGRIIPAYAGSTWFRESPTASAADHPRIRGEHRSTVNAINQPCGSSPHTRGAPDRGLSDRGYPGDHPRIRGEHAALQP